MARNANLEAVGFMVSGNSGMSTVSRTSQTLVSSVLGAVMQIVLGTVVFGQRHSFDDFAGAARCRDGNDKVVWL